MTALLQEKNALLDIPKYRLCSESEQAGVFGDIYHEENNIVIWQRNLSPEIQSSVVEFLKENPAFQTSVAVTPENALANLNKKLGSSNSHQELNQDIAQLVEMFCYLFDLEEAGLRLTILDRAMCPRFHTDKVPCRLVTTYQGTATEWLPHHIVDRSKLGPRSKDISDEESGLFTSTDDIKHLECGDVALLKGELWEGNENAGLVHRSPCVANGESRLLLTLDFLS